MAHDIRDEQWEPHEKAPKVLCIKGITYHNLYKYDLSCGCNSENVLILFGQLGGSLFFKCPDCNEVSRIEFSIQKEI